MIRAASHPGQPLMTTATETLELTIPLLRQTDDVSCGPTCLHQVLRFFGSDVSSAELSTLIQRNADGGTQAVFLALAAQRIGFPCTLYPYDLRVFDPTWFALPRAELVDKLKRREAVVRRRKLAASVRGYRQFLEGGGRIRFEELSRQLVVRILKRGHPVLCGLSATHLYRQIRERPADNWEDDIAGEPVGHFVVVSGFRDSGRSLLVSDPWPHAPFPGGGPYSVPSQRLLNAVLLGDVTYDAVLLEIAGNPRDRER